MKFAFSLHSIELMKLRQISKGIVTEILENPDQVIKNGDQRIYQAVRGSGKQRYLFRIFVNIKKET